jgi:hypothetical protein
MPVAVSAVNVPAAGVVPPIVVPSIVPPLMSAVVATRLAIVPKLVREEASTLEANVAPVSVPAGAVPVMLPVTLPTKPVEAVIVVPVIVVKAPVEAEEAPIAVPSMLPALASIVGIVTVPVKVGLEVFALEFTAVSILANSVLISVPLTTLLALPEGRSSLAAKSVDLV